MGMTTDRGADAAAARSEADHKGRRQTRRVAVPTPRPAHLRATTIALVVAGGAAGTFARYELSRFVPGTHGVPLGIFLINCVGAFLLGALLEVLARGGADVGLRRSLRLGVGTGVLGGFTTYSTFAVGADGLFSQDAFGAAMLYAGATVVVGTAAALVGIILSAKYYRGRTR